MASIRYKKVAYGIHSEAYVIVTSGKVKKANIPYCNRIIVWMCTEFYLISSVIITCFINIVLIMYF